MAIATTKLGGTASSVSIAKVAHGLMMMSWKTPVVPDEQAFEAIKAGLDLVQPGEKVLLNSGKSLLHPILNHLKSYTIWVPAEFYGHTPRTANLEMLARFFAQYPEYKERAFLSVKGGTGPTDLNPDSTPENLRRRYVCILLCRSCR